MAGFLICVFLTATFVGCNSSPQVESVEPYEPFEPAKRIEDTRDIDDYSFTVNSIVAEDDYGVITYSADGIKTDKERYVGMFYFLNLGMGADVNGTYNVTEIIKKYGIEEFGKNSTVSPAGVSHHWGQPVFGYYHSGDTWVIRKQVEMLTMAGVDFICFDTSNAVTYDDNAEKVLDIILEYHEAGWNVPKVMYHLTEEEKRISTREILRPYMKSFISRVSMTISGSSRRESLSRSLWKLLPYVLRATVPAKNKKSWAIIFTSVMHSGLPQPIMRKVSPGWITNTLSACIRI